MNKYHNMTYDNKHISGGERVEISVSHDDLVYYAKQVFKWRSSTKRVFSLGSRDYDNLIEFIARMKRII